MNAKRIVICLSCMLLGAGCSQVLIVRDQAAGGLPLLSAAQIANAGLSGLTDDVYIAFADDCPTSATAIAPQCSPPLSDAVCRGAGGAVIFKAASDESPPGPSFGILFDTMRPSVPVAERFNPCTQDISGHGTGAKPCTIRPRTEWPGAGQVDLIIKYSVTTPSGGTCALDPYLILKR